MDAFAQYLELWNSWVVMPALLVAAVVTHWRFRKRSTLILVVGLALVVIAQTLRALYPAPMHPAFVTSIIVAALGLLASLSGFVWFMWKDYRRPPHAT